MIYDWSLELFCSNPSWFAQVFPQCALSQLVRPPDVDDVTGEALLWGVLDHLHGAAVRGGPTFQVDAKVTSQELVKPP